MFRAITLNFYQLDILLFKQIYRLNGKRIMDGVFYYLTRSGDGYYYGLVAILLLVFDIQIGKQAILMMFASFALELPAHSIAKKTVKRMRPFEKLGIVSLVAPPDKYSFPSGHTAAAFVMANILSVFFPASFYLFFLWASAVGVSRIYLGVHYPSDIAAGAVLGYLSSQIGIWIVL